MINLLLRFSYDGSNFYGFQKQPNFRSVQQELENVLSKLFNKEIKIYGSGRTDAKVHALNQYANFFIDKLNYDLNDLKYRLNKMLPNDIYIKDIKQVDENFNARFNVKIKIYDMVINNFQHDPFLNNYVIDSFNKTSINKMKKIAKLFIGQKCFINFTSKEEDEFNFIRCIYKIKIFKKNNLIHIRFYGDGFMRYQVRMISANILLYGQNKIKKEEILDKLNNLTSRNITAYCLNANGLYLFDVKY